MSALDCADVPKISHYGSDLKKKYLPKKPCSKSYLAKTNRLTMCFGSTWYTATW